MHVQQQTLFACPLSSQTIASALTQGLGLSQCGTWLTALFSLKQDEIN